MSEDCNVNLPFFSLNTATLFILVFFTTIFIKMKSRRGRLKYILVNNMISCNYICNLLEKDCLKYPVLGMDAEWIKENNVRRPIALLQLCSADGTCGLFRLNKFKKIPKSLKQLLENPSIVKVGVVSKRDALYLMDDYELVVVNTLDLSYLYHVVGLARLSETFINLKLEKDNAITCSNWEASELSESQVKYAAIDAFAGVELFKNWAEPFLKSKMTWEEIWKELEPFLDKIYNSSGKVSTAKSNCTKDSEEKMKKFCIKKDNIYDDCVMYAPDGTLLSRTSIKNAQYYLRKNLAELMTKEPFAIRLRFKPKKMPKPEENLFSKELRFDICVICGATQFLFKHWIVPKMYTKHFPVRLKSRTAHDIVLVCASCLRKCDVYETQLKKKLSLVAMVKLPLSRVEDKQLYGYIIALLRNRKQIPQQKIIQMEEEIKLKFNLTEITNDALRLLKNQSEVFKLNNGEAQQVVQHFSEDGRSLFQFQVCWRENFIENANPQYMPKYWSVHYKK